MSETRPSPIGSSTLRSASELCLAQMQDDVHAQILGFMEFLVPTQPCLFMVTNEKIFTGTIMKSIRNVMITARDTSLGTCLRWLRPLKERPPMDTTSHKRGKLNATPNRVVTVPGLVRAKYAVARPPIASVYGVIVAWNMLTGSIQLFRQTQPCQKARRLPL